MAEIAGLLFGAFFWPWVCSKLLQSLGIEPRRAVWTGYLLSVVAAAAISAATGYPVGNVALFAVFGLGWSFWLAGPKPQDVDEEQAELSDDDDPGRSG